MKSISFCHPLVSFKIEVSHWYRDRSLITGWGWGEEGRLVKFYLYKKGRGTAIVLAMLKVRTRKVLE